MVSIAKCFYRFMFGGSEPGSTPQYATVIESRSIDGNVFAKISRRAFRNGHINGRMKYREMLFTPNLIKR